MRTRLGRYRRQLTNSVASAGQSVGSVADVDWETARARIPERRPGRVSVVVVPTADMAATTRTANSVRATARDVEVVTAATPGRAASVNAAVASTTGDVVVVVTAGVDLLPDWCEPLIVELGHPGVLGVQPLILNPDGSVASAGRALPESAPSLDLMASHPREDVLGAAPVTLRIVSSRAFAVRATDLLSMNGFDTTLAFADAVADFCLRLIDGGTPRYSLVPSALVVDTVGAAADVLPGDNSSDQSAATFVERWGDAADPADLDLYGLAGLAIADAPTGSLLVSRVSRPSRTVQAGPAAGLPSLRWAIKIAAHAGPRGDSWGDVHFAAAMARALRTLGQEVVVDRRLAVVRDSSSLDDVVLVIRGLDHVVPQTDAIRILWVISHPELVDDSEIDSYDCAFAASEVWSRRKTASGHAVAALLQATDPAMFTPDVEPVSDPAEVLFIGRSRNILRPIVRDAVAAGLPLAIYGDDWAQFGLERFVRAGYLPYDEVPRYYASAGVVLNDHWEDMAAEGFVSNRLFDAVACGACVVSDEVSGLELLFNGAVQVAHSVDDLRDLCGPNRDLRFPDLATRRTIAERVRTEHSFQARARTLLEAALAVRGPA